MSDPLFNEDLPTVSALKNFSSEAIHKINNVAVEFIREKENDLFSLFNYTMPKKAMLKLNKDEGIYLSVNPCMPHSHPVCKTLENYFLYVVLPNYIDGSFFFVSCKKNKLDFLKSRNKRVSTVQLINRFVTSKDLLRYDSNNFSYTRVSSMEMRKRIEKNPNLGMRIGGCDFFGNFGNCTDTLRDLIPEVLKCKARRLFLHDELHYWDQKDLLYFLEVCRPEVLLATVVFPPEIIGGAKESLNKWCYTFDITDDGKSIIFSPDGKAQESYVQPFQGGYLLKTSKIVTRSGLTYSLDIVQSKFAHHLISITLCDKVSDKIRKFGSFEAIEFKDNCALSNKIKKCYPISFDVVMRIYRYSQTIKKIDVNSLISKFSQLVPNCTSAEMHFAMDFANLLLKTKPCHDLFSSTKITDALHSFESKFPLWIAQKLPGFMSMETSKFVNSLTPFAFTVETVTLSMDDPVLIDTNLDITDLCGAKDVVNNMDAQFFGNFVDLLREREPRPYNFGEDVPFKFLHPKNVSGKMFENMLFDFYRKEVTGLAIADVNVIMYQINISFERSKVKKKSFNRSLVDLLFRFNNTLCSSVNLNFVKHRLLTLANMEKGKNNLFLFKSFTWFLLRKDLRRNQKYICGESNKRPVPSLRKLCALALKKNFNTGSNAQEKMEENNDKQKKSEGEGGDILPGPSAGGGVQDESEDTSQSEDEDTSSLASEDSEYESDQTTDASESSLSDQLTKLKVENFSWDSTESLHLINAISRFVDYDRREMTEKLHLGGLMMIKAFLADECSTTLVIFNEEVREVEVTCSKKFIVLVESGNDSMYYNCYPKSSCVLKAIDSSVKIGGVLNVYASLYKELDTANFHKAIDEYGLNFDLLGTVFTIFGIAANILTEDGSMRLGDGDNKQTYVLKNSHIERIEYDEALAKYGNKMFRKTSGKIVTAITHFSTSIVYLPIRNRAEVLFKSIKNGDTGVILKDLSEDKFDFSNPISAMLHPFFGIYGSGKTYQFKNLATKNRNCYFSYITPRRKLAEQVSEELQISNQFTKIHPKSAKCRNVRVFTLEVALLHFSKVLSSSMIILDEFQLYPPGYLDLILFHVRGAEMPPILLAGDPLQSDYDSQSDRLNLEELGRDIDNVLRGKSYCYNVLSRRFQNQIFNKRVPGHLKIDNALMKEWNFISLDSFAKSNGIDALLVSSFNEKKAMLVYFKGPILTFGESTGLTFNSVAILISADSVHVNERRWITALTRARIDITFVNATSVGINELADRFSGRFLYKFFCEGARDQDILENLPGRPILVEGFGEKIGFTADEKLERLSGDPWLKGMLFLGSDPVMIHAEPEMPDVSEELFKTHIPLVTLEGIRADWVEKIMVKEFRERGIKDCVTDQFPDTYGNNNGVRITNQAEQFSCIYPRHKNADVATFLMAVKKRLKFSSARVESEKMNKYVHFGKFFLETFLSKVPMKPNKNDLYAEEARHEFEIKKMSKPISVIENHSERSCTDWPLDKCLIFMKNQHCTKFEKRFTEAKAGQTLACFHHAVLCRFAPTMRYIEKKLNEALPKNFYIHSCKNIDDLNEWVMKQRFDGVCTESDYEAFDASQDAIVLSFELALMRYLEINESVVNDYIYIKTHLGSKLGSFAIMRFTGEASTFLFNTMANMLFTFLRYDINGHESICFAGDDMCANKKLTVKLEHEALLEKMSLKAKVCFTRKPTFCGWMLTRDGVLKKPQLICERLAIAVELGKLEDCIDNYALEASYAYKLGERLFDLLDETEMKNHFQCVRFLIEKNWMMKSEARNIFKNGVNDRIYLRSSEVFDVGTVAKGKIHAYLI
ncbi:polyprotein [Yam virus Y]|nr:polyprotein [Yam virus Y]